MARVFLQRVLSLVIVNGRLSSEKYCDILESILLNQAGQMLPDGLVSNRITPARTLIKRMMSFLWTTGVNILDCMEWSPDLNPIQNLRVSLVLGVYKNGRQLNTVDDL